MMLEISLAVFEDASQEFLNEALAIGTQRGGEYADTWALENQHPGFTAAMRKLADGDTGPEADRLIRAAGLVDTKISRIINGGPYKRDSYVDLINYLASLAKFHEEYAKPKDVASSAVSVIEGARWHDVTRTDFVTRCCIGDGCETRTAFPQGEAPTAWLCTECAIKPINGSRVTRCVA